MKVQNPDRVTAQVQARERRCLVVSWDDRPVRINSVDPKGAEGNVVLKDPILTRTPVLLEPRCAPLRSLLSGAYGLSNP